MARAFEYTLAEAWELDVHALGTEPKKAPFYVYLPLDRPPPGSSAARNAAVFLTFSDSMREEMPDEDVRGIKRLVQHADRALSTAHATRLLAESNFSLCAKSALLDATSGEGRHS